MHNRNNKRSDGQRPPNKGEPRKLKQASKEQKQKEEVVLDLLASIREARLDKVPALSLPFTHPLGNVGTTTTFKQGKNLQLVREALRKIHPTDYFRLCEFFTDTRRKILTCKTPDELPALLVRVCRLIDQELKEAGQPGVTTDAFRAVLTKYISFFNPYSLSLSALSIAVIAVTLERRRLEPEDVRSLSLAAMVKSRKGGDFLHPIRKELKRIRTCDKTAFVEFFNQFDPSRSWCLEDIPELLVLLC